MPTVPLDLDGYTDLPPGKIANVVTFFETTAPPGGRRIDRPDLRIAVPGRPDPAWYRRLYSAVGADWLWFSRAVMPDAELASMLADPAIEILVLEREGDAIGLAELVHLEDAETEILNFGVVPAATGTGAARYLMEATLDRLFAGGRRRVWLHTCTFDHPAAVRFYRARGFRAFKFAIEVVDDPRLAGYLPRTAAPHIPVIEPSPVLSPFRSRSPAASR